MTKFLHHLFVGIACACLLLIFMAAWFVPSRAENEILSDYPPEIIITEIEDYQVIPDPMYRVAVTHTWVIKREGIAIGKIQFFVDATWNTTGYVKINNSWGKTISVANIFQYYFIRTSKSGFGVKSYGTHWTQVLNTDLEMIVCDNKCYHVHTQADEYGNQQGKFIFSITITPYN